MSNIGHGCFSAERNAKQKQLLARHFPYQSYSYISLVGWVQEMADVSEVIAQLFPPGS